MERGQVTVQEAARRLAITESAVRKRAQRGQLRSEKVTEGKKERLYIYLDKDQDAFPEPFRERYIRSMEDRVQTLEDMVFRQQAIIVSLSQSVQALTAGSEAAETPGEVAEGSERTDEPEESQVDTRQPSVDTEPLATASSEASHGFWHQ
jgi:predicted ArsR family transcriptional regulator